MDRAANAKLVDNLIEAGTDGALFLGSTGEFFNLNMEEKKEHFSFIADHAKGRFSLFAGTGGHGHPRDRGIDPARAGVRL